VRLVWAVSRLEKTNTTAIRKAAIVFIKIGC
jgi:hypothetical protein